MKRRILIVLILVLIIGAALIWYLCCKSVGNHLAQQQHRDDNDACVGDELKQYAGELKHQLEFRGLQNLDEAMPQERKQKSTRAEFIRFIDKADFFRQELACHGDYLPFKIQNGKIQYYPGDNPPCPRSKPTHSPSPSPLPAASPTRTPPQSIQNNEGPILELAKSVGRLGIRRAGTNAYPAFWGTGFLVAPDVIMTTCHVMDPIMTLEGGKHHLHLDGEELFINFKWHVNENTEEYDYDYQCLIKDVLACSSRPGVDVALLYFDKTQCTPSGELPPSAILDTNEPHATSPSKDKQNDCAMAMGKDCLAMIAYADLDHPIDAPTNAVYRVYQDPKYGGDAQFVMNDDVALIDKCDKESKVEIMMDIATTTVGESGGVLTYLNQLVDKQLIVSGMHTCCSAFFNYDYEIPPASDTACARLRRTLDNQAISTWSMLQDRELCRTLKDHHATFYPDVDCKQ